MLKTTTVYVAGGSGVVSATSWEPDTRTMNVFLIYAEGYGYELLPKRVRECHPSSWTPILVPLLQMEISLRSVKDRFDFSRKRLDAVAATVHLSPYAITHLQAAQPYESLDLVHTTRELTELSQRFSNLTWRLSGLQQLLTSLVEALQMFEYSQPTSEKNTDRNRSRCLQWRVRHLQTQVTLVQEIVVLRQAESQAQIQTVSNITVHPRV